MLAIYGVACTLVMVLPGHRARPVDPAFLIAKDWPEVRSGQFVLRSNLPEDLHSLISLAEQTQARARIVTGKTASPETRTAIFLCRDLMDLARIETACGYRHSWTAPGRTQGGFYSEVQMIAVTVGADRLEETLSHEVVHSSLREDSENLPTAIEEGLAMHISEDLTRDHPRGARCWAAHYSYVGPLVARAIRLDELPSLNVFISMTGDTFRADRTTVNFHLAHCLATVLLSSSEPGISGKLPEYFAATAGEGESWQVFCSVYPAKRVEELWNREIEQSINER